MSGKNEKDPQIWELKKCKFYKENSLHYLEKVGFLPVNKFHQMWYTIHNGIVLLLLIVTCFLVFKDYYSEFVEVIHFTVLLLLTEVSYTVSPKDVLRELIRKCDEGVPDYGKTLDPKSLDEIQKMKSIIYKRKNFRVKFMTIGLYGTTFSLNFVRSVYDYSAGKYERTDLIKENVNRYLPVHMWCPFVSKWYGQLFTFLLQYYNTGMTTLAVIACSTTFIVVSEEICFHLFALKVGLRHLKRRLQLAEQEEPSNIQFRQCFKTSVAHHNRIIEIFDLYQNFFFWMLWLIVTLCTYLICLSGFSLTMDDLKMNDAVVMVFFLFFEMLNILMICWYGEQMKTLSEELRVAIYESDWIEHRVALKNYISIIQSRTLRPIQLSCGGLVDANLETFSDVCGTAYSYFNLLRASKK